jgi:hypothetical protein
MCGFRPKINFKILDLYTAHLREAHTLGCGEEIGVTVHQINRTTQSSPDKSHNTNSRKLNLDIDRGDAINHQSEVHGDNDLAVMLQQQSL